jgi:MHS family alpha-ketoglutarate permease-like MFS transporter
MTSDVSEGAARLRAETVAARNKGSVVLGATIGNFIEWYDWTIYGLFSGVFSSQIFPSNDKTVSLLVVLATFALGFLMRPVGAIVLSPLADRLGRRQMLSLTLLLMGAGSLAIALTPSFDKIGYGAPVIMLLARLLQGFSAGGEYQGASVFLVEHAPAHRRGLVGSMQNLSIGVAVLVANGVASLTTASFAPDELREWGWRVPFAVGALMSLYGLYIRKGLPETPLFIETAQRAAIEKRPLLQVIREFPREALYVFSIQMTTVFFYLWTIYLPTYANLVSGLPLKQGFIGGTIGLACFCIALPLAGHLSDRIGRKPLLLATSIGFLLLAYPMLSAIRGGGMTSFVAVACIGCMLIALLDAVMPAVLCELFPTRVRASGVGLPYAVASAVFGGTTPLIATSLISSGFVMGPAFYVMLLAAICTAVYLTMPETSGRSLH